ncbi:HAMP domain-containing sensor histidine kinase [Acetanaerobacterium elongatum]|uniref:histidine kinase n=1 Tax=Acetanaerobacterium elongatum TaxID=258515 RepID=A0A1H0CLU7_9FIRM|nr:ATP-binding protein [Acetanaerobacterium elongatum]SDN58866.1 histidine kinase [Acetanaerobacterium elongatum]
MKNKIAVKLTVYFSAVLVLFSVVIGGVFAALFKSHTLQLSKEDMQIKAVSMAQTLSELMTGSYQSGMMGKGMGMGRGGYGMYLRLLDKIAMTDVWVVDENLQLITSGMMTSTEYNYADLPQDAEAVVKKAFEGQTTFSQSFSSMLNTPVLTVGTPIIINGSVSGVLLMHAAAKGMDEAASQGIGILVISMLAALVLAVILSIVLALAFSKPLRQMKTTALQLAEGNYSARTEVRQKDEIGELAATIDTLSLRLEQASHESERLEKLRREFIVNISHELRTPVTVVRASLEALCDGIVNSPKQVDAYHRQMLKDSVFLERLVNDLLDLSRLQNLDFKMEMQELNWCDVISDAVRSIKQAAQPKQVDVRLQLDTPAQKITGDYGRLRQMLLIILDNAVKFSPEGTAVTVTKRENTVTVQDNGPGIPSDDLPYIFDRFYKVKSKANSNGTGLGLAIAKQIAQRHHIEIRVKSEEGSGTEFMFII